jgi:hypothetical protein
MAKSLKDLKKKEAAPAQQGDAAVAEAPKAEAPKKEKKAKEEKPKLSPEELAELRRKNLKPVQKSPEKAKEDEALKAAITSQLQANPKGLQASDLRKAIFEATENPADIKSQEKRIRFMCRDLGCTREEIGGTRKKLYILK